MLHRIYRSHAAKHLEHPKGTSNAHEALAADLLSDEVCSACLDTAGEKSCWEWVFLRSRKVPLPKIVRGSQQLLSCLKELPQSHLE